MKRVLRSPVGLVTLVAVLALAGYAAYQFYPRHGAARVKQLVDWDSSCGVVIHKGDRYTYADGWRGIQDASVVSCEHLGPSVFYARFRDDAALQRVLRTSPPLSVSCVYGDDELATGDLDTRAEFEALCSDLHGRLRAPPPDADARRARALRERTAREHGNDPQEDSHH